MKTWYIQFPGTSTIDYLKVPAESYNVEGVGTHVVATFFDEEGLQTAQAFDPIFIVEWSEISGEDDEGDTEEGECKLHLPVPHNDGCPPWCDTCGLTRTGKDPKNWRRHQ